MRSAILFNFLFVNEGLRVILSSIFFPIKRFSKIYPRMPKLDRSKKFINYYDVRYQFKFLVKILHSQIFMGLENIFSKYYNSSKKN